MRLLVPVLVLLLSAPALAEEAGPCVPQDYDSETQPRFDCPGPGEAELRVDLDAPAPVAVREGQAVEAPWDGALLHRHRLVEVGLNLMAVRRLRWLDRLRLSEECSIDLEHAQEVAQARLTFAEQQRDGYEERWQEAERRVVAERSWYRSWAFGLIVGVVLSVAITVSAAYLAVSL